MPFEVNDNVTKKTLIFENKPTEQDLMEAFGSLETVGTTQQEKTPNAIQNIPKLQSEDWRHKASKIQRGVIPYLGLGLGGLAGGVTGLAGGPAAPATVPLGALAGEALGYAGGEKVSDLIDRALGVNKRPTDLYKELKSSAKDIGTGAGLAMGGRGIGKAAEAIIQKIVSPGINKMGGMPSDISDYARSIGYRPFPTDTTASKTLGIADSVLSYAPFSGDVMLKRRLMNLESLNNEMNRLIKSGNTDEQTIEWFGKQMKSEARNILEKYSSVKGKAMDEMVQDFLGKVGIESPTPAGKTIQDLLSSKKDAMFKGAGDKIKQATEMFKNIEGKAPITNTEKIAQQLHAEETAKPLAWQDRDLVERLKSFLKNEPSQDIFKLVENLDPAKKAEFLKMNPDIAKMLEGETKTIPVATLQKLRSDALEEVRKSNILQGTSYTKGKGNLDNTGRINSMLADALDKDLTSYLQKTDPTALNLLKQGREGWGIAENVFDKDILGIMKANPKDVVNRITKRGGVELIKEIKNTIGEDGLIPIRQQIFGDLFTSSTKNGILHPARMETIIKSYGEAWNETTTPLQREGINNIIKKRMFFDMKSKNMKTVNFLNDIVKSEDTNVVAKVIKPNDIENVKLLRRLYSPETVNDITSKVLESKIFVTTANKNILPVSSEKNFLKYESVLKELYKDNMEGFSNLQKFTQLGSMGQRLQRLAENASQTGQVFIGWDYAKRAVAMFAGGSVAGVGAETLGLMGGTYLLSKIYTSPVASRYFTRAIKLPPESPMAIENFVKALAIIGRDEKEDEKENVKK